MKRIIFIFVPILFISNVFLYSQGIEKIKLYKDSTFVYYFYGKSTKKTSSGVYKDKKETFRISIFDYNDNGIFNEPEIDYIIITMPNEVELRYHFGVSFKRIEDEMFIKTNNRTFKIVEIDSLGQHIKINETKESGDYFVKLINQIPNMQFTTLKGSQKNFRDYVDGEKFIYVEFWGLWCGGCIQILPELSKVYQHHKNKLTFIYLNAAADKRLKKLNISENIEDIEALIEKYKLEEWIHGISNNEIENEFLINGYPYGVLFDKNGNVIKFNCSYKDLDNILNNLE